MNDEQFDDLMKRRLHGHESGVPGNMWERIAGSEKKRRRVVGWRWYTLALLLLVTGLGAAYFVFTNSDSSSISPATTKDATAYTHATNAQKNSRSQRANPQPTGTTNEKVATQTVTAITAKKEETAFTEIDATAARKNKPRLSNKQAVLKSNGHTKQNRTQRNKKPHGVWKKLVTEKTNPDPLSGNTTSEAVVNQPAQPEAAKKAALENKTAATKSPIKLQESVTLRAGLHWTAPVPLAGAPAYFNGATAAQQLAVFVPGAWVSITIDRMQYALEAQPVAMAVLKPYVFSNISTAVDPRTTRTTTQTIQKLTGFALGVQVHRNIAEGWWLGGSLQGFFWKRGISSIHNHTETRGTDDHILTTEDGATAALSFKNPALSAFSNFQPFLNAELRYQKDRWEAGLRAGGSVVPFSEKGGPAHQFQSSLFLRWRLIQKSVPLSP